MVYVAIHYRQGDLLFVQLPTPPDAVLVQRESDIILMGEATGHAHRLTSGIVLDAPDGTIYLHLPLPAEVVHDEHNPIDLPEGWWCVVRQREYTPAEIRHVED
jgi:hypothetical protein